MVFKWGKASLSFFIVCDSTTLLPTVERGLVQNLKSCESCSSDPQPGQLISLVLPGAWAAAIAIGSAEAWGAELASQLTYPPGGWLA